MIAKIFILEAKFEILCFPTDQEKQYYNYFIWRNQIQVTTGQHRVLCENLENRFGLMYGQFTACYMLQILADLLILWGNMNCKVKCGPSPGILANAPLYQNPGVKPPFTYASLIREVSDTRTKISKVPSGGLPFMFNNAHFVQSWGNGTLHGVPPPGPV